MRFPRISIRKTALAALAVLVAVAAIGQGLRSCVEEQREHAFRARRAPLAASLSKHRALLARASALQPSFREMSTEITPSRCREILALVRARYEQRDPFAASGVCPEVAGPPGLDPCEGARVFAEVGGGETQLARPVGLTLQSRKLVGTRDAERVEVITLLLSTEHRLLEVHQLTFQGASMDGAPSLWLVRSSGDDGLLERRDAAGVTDVWATLPDGAVRLHRRAKGKGEVTERVRGSGAEGWSKAHLWPTLGVRYETTEGLACDPPTWSELQVERRGEADSCTRVTVHEGGASRSWSRGKGCEAGEP
jgi:hypothetical protein